MTTKEELLKHIRERREIIEANAKKMEFAMRQREVALEYREGRMRRDLEEKNSQQ